MHDERSHRLPALAAVDGHGPAAGASTSVASRQTRTGRIQSTGVRRSLAGCGPGFKGQVELGGVAVRRAAQGFLVRRRGMGFPERCEQELRELLAELGVQATPGRRPIALERATDRLAIPEETRGSQLRCGSASHRRGAHHNAPDRTTRPPLVLSASVFAGAVLDVDELEVRPRRFGGCRIRRGWRTDDPELRARGKGGVPSKTTLEEIADLLRASPLLCPVALELGRDRDELVISFAVHRRLSSSSRRKT